MKMVLEKIKAIDDWIGKPRFNLLQFTCIFWLGFILAVILIIAAVRWGWVA